MLYLICIFVMFVFMLWRVFIIFLVFRFYIFIVLFLEVVNVFLLFDVILIVVIGFVWLESKLNKIFLGFVRYWMDGIKVGSDGLWVCLSKVWIYGYFGGFLGVFGMLLVMIVVKCLIIWDVSCCGFFDSVFVESWIIFDIIFSLELVGFIDNFVWYFFIRDCSDVL